MPLGPSYCRWFSLVSQPGRRDERCIVHFTALRRASGDRHRSGLTKANEKYREHPGAYTLPETHTTEGLFYKYFARGH